MNARKILIIRFSSIGDIVLTSPVVRCLKQQLGVEVHYLAKKGYRSILTGNPYIDKVYTFDQKLEEVLPALRKENYDFVVDLHRNLRSLQVKRALRKPSRSFRKLNWKKWLLVRFKINRMPDVHIVDRYLQTVENLGVTYDGRGLDYFIPADQEIDLQQFAMQHFTEELPESSALRMGRYIAVVIGAAHATKRLPVEKIAAICRDLQPPVVLLGGPDDAERGQQIVKAVGPRTINTCGQLSLHQSASLVRQAACVITHDTGLMHIAAAFQKNILSVWGNTVPSFGMYPFYPDHVQQNTTFEVKGLSCRPCSKIGFDKCPKGHFDCMNQLSESEIVGKAHEKVLNHFA